MTAVNGQPISYDNDGALKMREQVQAADDDHGAELYP